MSDTPSSSDGGGFRILFVPEDGSESRSIRIGRRALRLLVVAAAGAAVVLTAMAGSWWYLATWAARAGELEARVQELEGREERIQMLAGRLREVESRYDRLRDLFGSDTSRVASDLWLPPMAAAGRSGAGGDGASGPPTSWPLTRRGFITQPLLQGDDAQHQGLDIAIPSHSYIRAAGAGVVEEVGEDAVYGNFVIVEHGEGYRTLYGHASETLVESGQRVRRNEVIALTGSTGRSTAPHLHFEVLRDGEAVDPLTLVQQP